MQVLSVTFERVFDLHRWDASKGSPRHTTFSFVVDGKPHYAVSIPEWPTIESGTTVTAFLREADNWQSLVGWINQQTNDVVMPNHQQSLTQGAFGVLLALLGYPGLFGAGSPTFSVAGQIWSGVFVALVILCSLFMIRKGLRERGESMHIQKIARKQIA